MSTGPKKAAKKTTSAKEGVKKAARSKSADPQTPAQRKRTAENYVARQKEVERLSKLAHRIVPNTEKAESAQARFPKMTLSDDQFEVIASLIRSRDPSRKAAYMVLVKGIPMSEAARSVKDAHGEPLKAQMVNNTVTRFKAAHTLICSGYTQG